MDKQTFGTFVAEQRKRQGLTQRQLAQLLHVTDKAVSKWERGLSYPDVTLLQPLAAALCLDTDRLLTCRREESEEHMTQITPPLPKAEASPAVQAVLDISDANRRQRRKRQRLMAAAAAVRWCMTPPGASSAPSAAAYTDSKKQAVHTLCA